MLTEVELTHRIAADIPASWRKLMASLPVGAAVIAGGAPRDLALGRPIKDIDIWTNEEGWGAIFDALNGDGSDCFRVSDADSAPDEDTEIERVWRFPAGMEGLDVDLICVKEGVDAIGRFDFGICQAVYDGGIAIRVTGAFVRDRRDKTFTFLRPDRNDWQRNISWKRWDRLKAKYPDYTLVGLAEPVKQGAAT